MAKQVAANWLTGITIPKTALKKILESGSTVTNVASEVANPNIGDELTGELVVEGYPELEELTLDNNEITKLTVKNCPKLKILNVGTNPLLTELNIDEIVQGGDSLLESLACGGTVLTKVSFRNCKNLKTFDCPNTPTLDRIEKIDSLENVESLNMVGSGKVRIMHEVKYNYITTVVNEVKDMLGIPHEQNLPMKPGTSEIDTDKLKEDIKISANKDELDAIKTALDLAITATKDQVLEAIQKLKDAGSGNNYISKTSLISSGRDSLKGLGISEGDIDKKFEAAASARDVETSRNELINNRFGELQNKLKYAHYWNAGLVTFSVLILLILVWMVLKNRKLLPGQEKEEEKD